MTSPPTTSHAFRRCATSTETRTNDDHITSTTEAAQDGLTPTAPHHCRRCHTDLPQSEFYVRKATGKRVNNVCRQCTSLLNAASRARDLERLEP